MAVEDELGLRAGIGLALVVHPPVADGPHPVGGGAGDVGAAQVADVQRLAGSAPERRQRRFEDLRRRLVVADLVGEGPAGEVAEQALRGRAARAAARRR